ncbi:DNA segregation ATPase FtsK/SpoIIIE and related protein [Serpentinimonas raichei]|uniref:DNA segregation ATPase FtsK/SpoIIIE and related protein n=1 Tax=Serpentinimonas raichei TaxID=1458425 RepID=A0A060NGK0_9BURK|nr:DNA translocase FtsK [Serpentinimonas raichei]BAO80082.1 DNA segregation ATPase FtsK/SpoIIIE and related protein [Serpentinimonas raichei]
MSSSVNTLNKDAARAAASGIGRFTQEFALLLGAAALLFGWIALLSYSPGDAAWSTSGSGAVTANWGGRAGAWLADLGYFLLGASVWWLLLAASHTWLAGLARWLRVPAAAAAANTLLRPETPLAALRARWQQPPWSRVAFGVGLLLLLAASTVLEWTRLHRWDAWLPGDSGGLLGSLLGPPAQLWLGQTGSALLAISLLGVALAWVFRFSWAATAEGLGRWIDEALQHWRQRREADEDQRIGRQALRQRTAEEAEYERAHPAHALNLQGAGPADPDTAAGLQGEVQADPVHAAPRKPAASAGAKSQSKTLQIEPVLAEVPPSSRVIKERQQPLFHDLSDTKLPQIDLLDAATRQSASVAPETLEMTSRLIEKKLGDFGVQVTVVAALPGPVITRYEIEPATGVKGAQVVNLARDLARSLSLVSIRVIETIPGKNLMALELPNARRQTIRLSEILGSQVYHDAKSLLTMGLGKDIGGHPVVVDLAKMPHCLVAGTTGSGKSVGINAMILSLLYKADPRDVRLLLIDPKMLELSVYEGIAHLLAPVVTDMKQAANALNWCVAEMDKRYRLLSKLGVRNLAGYNAKIAEAAARGEPIGNPFSLTPEQPEPLQRLPHIVVVIDELADLMMVVGKKIEELIARLAQKARAAGVHLILATQRPSVDVITGLIKANIPTRISFQVSSKIDSRTILDQMGAEALLGMGDMLYMPSGSGYPSRIHGAFVSDDEVHRVVAWLKAQCGEPDYIAGVLEGPADAEEGGEADAHAGGGEKDPLYDQAVAIVLQDRKASISYVQRKLKIGYNRAARLLEDMERAGLVSALTSSGQRDILVGGRSAE